MKFWPISFVALLATTGSTFSLAQTSAEQRGPELKLITKVEEPSDYSDTARTLVEEVLTLYFKAGKFDEGAMKAAAALNIDIDHRALTTFSIPTIVCG